MIVYRSHSEDQIQLSIKIAREVLKVAYEVLRTPMPDAFAGRRTQEPFEADERLELMAEVSPMQTVSLDSSLEQQVRRLREEAKRTPVGTRTGSWHC